MLFGITGCCVIKRMTISLFPPPERIDSLGEASFFSTHLGTIGLTDSCTLTCTLL